MLLHTWVLACQEQAISVSGPYASLPSSICLRLLKTSRTLAESYFQREAGQGVGDSYLKTEVDESRTKCKETDSYLFTFLMESSASHAHFESSNLVCTIFCARVILLLGKSIPFCVASQSKTFVSSNRFQSLLCCPSRGSRKS